MNKWRTRAVEQKAVKKDSTYGELTDPEVKEAADDIYTVATSHRSTVIAKDKAAKARRRKK